MKKFFLVMVCAILIAVFIAFNYLLWDRESKLAEIKNLESVNASYSANISVQKREISALEDEIKGLNDQIQQYRAQIEKLQKEKEEALSEKLQDEAEFRAKIDLVNALKEKADIEFLSKPIVSWAEALNNGSYDEAYAIEFEGVPQKDRNVSLGTYVGQMESTVEKIEITEIKVDRFRGSANGEIYLEVTLNVTLREGADLSASRFSEGNNEMSVKLDYSKDKKGFVISSMNIY